MELKLKPYYQSDYPLSAILIRSGSLEQWACEIQRMRLLMHEFVAYPLAGTKANELWGCLLLLNKPKPNLDLGQNTFCQVINEILVTPVFSELYPKLSSEEIKQFFKEKPHFFHPEIGLTELEEAVDWLTLFETPAKSNIFYTQPHEGVFIPSTIKSYQIHELPPEEVLKRMEKDSFPERKKFDDKPLNSLEKMKLSVLKTMFNKDKNKKGEQAVTEKSRFAQKLESMFGGKKENNWVDKLQVSFEELERRNQKELDKLMDLFMNNPEEALKYAIPLDPNNSSRGGETESFSLFRLRNNFDLTGNTNSRGGGSFINNDYYNRLDQQYRQTAEEMIKKSLYDKAAFIYLKLLKDPVLAAEALENGKMYAEAASIYLKELNNKVKAAQCYEKARMTEKAIELYKELYDFEKAGDLYLQIGKRKEALHHFQLVVDEYVKKGQYVKAAVLKRNKMDDFHFAQELLLEGWRGKKDAINCLNIYFANIRDEKTLESTIQFVYQNEVNDEDKDSYLSVLTNQLDRSPEVVSLSTEMAYRIVSERVAKNPSIVSEIRKFNKNDKRLTRDIIRFKTKVKNEKA